MQEITRQQKTTRNYWEQVHTSKKIIAIQNRSNKFKAIYYALLDGQYSYAEYLRHKLFKKYLPKNNNFKVLEIGSAPGDKLIYFNKYFGYIPYGIEYTKEGYLTNKQKFIINNLDPKKIFHRDFFDDKFHKKYKSGFDIVFSYGFIEHFQDTKSIIDKHISLLKKGCYLIIIIPKLSGIYYPYYYLFDHYVLKIHNLNIMHLERFGSLFRNSHLQTLYCNYYGIAQFPYPRKNNILNKFISILNSILSIFLFTVRYLTFESKFTSPYLIYIGKKR